MGITRKILSVSTAGLVDFRSDKERTAAYTRGTRRATRKLVKQGQDPAPGSGVFFRDRAFTERATTDRVDEGFSALPQGVQAALRCVAHGEQVSQWAVRDVQAYVQAGGG